MRILAIDTTSEFGGAAVYEDGNRLGQALNEGGADRYSVTLFDLARRALEQAEISFTQLDLIAAANGPGSFTGIRVGLAAAQGWAAAFAKPLRGISILDAMVEQARPDSELGIPVMDARRGEFFLRVYRHASTEHSIFEPASEARVMPPGALAGFVQSIANEQGKTPVLITREHDAKARELTGEMSEQVQAVEIPSVLLAAIASLARAAHHRNLPVTAEEASAFYVRRSDAEMNWKGQ